MKRLIPCSRARRAGSLSTGSLDRLTNFNILQKGVLFKTACMFFAEIIPCSGFRKKQTGKEKSRMRGARQTVSAASRPLQLAFRDGDGGPAFPAFRFRSGSPPWRDRTAFFIRCFISFWKRRFLPPDRQPHPSTRNKRFGQRENRPFEHVFTSFFHRIEKNA